MKASVSSIPALLRSARREANMTQADLAARLAISQAAVAKLERPGANPTVGTLDRILWSTGHRLVLDVQARAPGVDESLIRRQLELTPAQRIRGIEDMYLQAQALAGAGALGSEQSS
jgi:transcriptional regulator with XRE-family HTH domain